MMIKSESRRLEVHVSGISAKRDVRIILYCVCVLQSAVLCIYYIFLIKSLLRVFCMLL